jgi:hypothetical protein
LGSEASRSSHTAHIFNEKPHRVRCCIVAARRQRPSFAQRSSRFGSGVASCDCI